MNRPCVFFLLNLLQDVNILRPLVFLAAKDLLKSVEILVTSKFVERDKSGLWRSEIQEISHATDARVTVTNQLEDALLLLEGKSGALIAASESNLSAHKQVHQIFKHASRNFRRITIQHGFESVGLLQSREHDRAHGKNVSFAADVLCVWSPPAFLTALKLQRHQDVLVTGPAAVLQLPQHDGTTSRPYGRGIVCENLHSVRLNAKKGVKSDFITVFSEFSHYLQLTGRKVTLRPHPAGQYTLKNRVVLPDNVRINNNPIYKVDLSRYDFGISAPSSILIDMLLSRLPTAVWVDGKDNVDASNYEGLQVISTVADWIEFSNASTDDPERLLDVQQAFLNRTMMPTAPEEVHARFAALLARSL
jgi:hypothetical protein